MLVAAAVLLLAGGPEASTSAMPAEVARHYAEYNAVNAFSTPRERYRIAEGTAPSDPRLSRVTRLLESIERSVDEVDPQMMGGRGGLKGHPAVYRSDLVRVVSWRMDRSGEEAWATLDVSALEGETNLLLVGRFDELAGDGRLPAADRLVALAPRAVHSTEVHHWRRVDGEWRRDAATVHFIAG